MNLPKTQTRKTCVLPQNGGLIDGPSYAPRYHIAVILKGFEEGPPLGTHNT